MKNDLMFYMLDLGRARLRFARAGLVEGFMVLRLTILYQMGLPNDINTERKMYVNKGYMHSELVFLGWR